MQQFFDSIIEQEAALESPVLEKYKDVVISDDIKSLTGILQGKYPDDINVWDAKYEYLKEKYAL